MRYNAAGLRYVAREHTPGPGRPQPAGDKGPSHPPSNWAGPSHDEISYAPAAARRSVESSPGAAADGRAWLDVPDRVAGFADLVRGLVDQGKDRRSSRTRSRGTTGVVCRAVDPDAVCRRRHAGQAERLRSTADRQVDASTREEALDEDTVLREGAESTHLLAVQAVTSCDGSGVLVRADLSGPEQVADKQLSRCCPDCRSARPTGRSPRLLGRLGR